MCYQKSDASAVNHNSELKRNQKGPSLRYFLIKKVLNLHACTKGLNDRSRKGQKILLFGNHTTFHCKVYFSKCQKKMTITYSHFELSVFFNVNIYPSTLIFFLWNEFVCVAPIASYVCLNTCTDHI